MIEVGQSVGNYNVTAKLGEGGMGIVFLAEHPVIGRKAALKAIHAKYARDLDVVSRFVTEAKAVNQIGHEHIVDVTDFGTTAGGDFYFIMEYLQGDALGELLDKEGRFPPERALAIAAQVADALQASHDHGVIHRDLKPDNVVLVTHGEDPSYVKVLDFGLAKLVGPDDPVSRHTRTGTVVGTPYYMSPEQCEGREEIDHRADIYSLGVMLFEMLTGKLPFGGTGYGEIILKHMAMPAPAARSVVPELPPALDAILARALAKDPARRFQSMAELRTALLDPDAYAASAPPLVSRDDLSGGRRAAAPMTRSEMNQRATLVTLSESPRVEPRHPSTLRESAGEAGAADLDDVPRNRRGLKLLLGGLVVAAGVIVAPAAVRRPAARVVAAAAALGGPATVRLEAAARALSRPASVRLNFNSEPAGAAVVRADGVVLGETPLSTEAAYGDAPSEYVLRKPGFLAKTVTIVPNLPSAVFALLQGEDPTDPPLVARSAAGALPVTVTEPRPTHRTRAARPRERDALPGEPPPIDEDETLAPTNLE